MSFDKTISALRGLARAYGVMPSFGSISDGTMWAPSDSLVSLINHLNAREVINPFNIECDRILHELFELRKRKLQNGFEGSVTASDGYMKKLYTWLPEYTLGKQLEIIIKTEDGGLVKEVLNIDDIVFIKRNFGDLGNYCRASIKCSQKVPYGYHRLELYCEGNLMGQSLLISSPKKLPDANRSWGAFAPVHALRSTFDWGIGSFTLLEQTAKFIKHKGGEYVGVLPMLAGFVDGIKANQSPYTPISRFFWNEVFLDVENLPCVKFGGFDEKDISEVETLRYSTHVDYERVYALKKKYIMRAAKKFFAGKSSQKKEFMHFLAIYPKIHDYAEFRASEFADHERKDIYNYHVYAQFAAHMQLSALKKKADKGEIANIYLDYPVGVSNDGFDVREMEHMFIPSYNVGAPPDYFVATGQDWGFRPINPRKMEEENFAYFIDSLRVYFRYSSIIRLDHVMGLHRIFCVPHGGKPEHGAYIYHNFDAMIAILSLECHRHNALVIGEDLGTVPPLVRNAMNESGILRMWLFQFYFSRTPEETFPSIPEMCIASMNTHDMFPFAAFLSGEDINILHSIGSFDEKRKQQIIDERNWNLEHWRGIEDTAKFVFRHLSRSSARFLLINLEDLWGEQKPQNIPGTMEEYPNWRRKFAHIIEDWTNNQRVNELLDEVNCNR